MANSSAVAGNAQEDLMHLAVPESGVQKQKDARVEGNRAGLKELPMAKAAAI